MSIAEFSSKWVKIDGTDDNGVSLEVPKLMMSTLVLIVGELCHPSNFLCGVAYAMVAPDTIHHNNKRLPFTMLPFTTTRNEHD